VSNGMISGQCKAARDAPVAAEDCGDERASRPSAARAVQTRTRTMNDDDDAVVNKICGDLLDFQSRTV